MNYEACEIVVEAEGLCKYRTTAECCNKLQIYFTLWILLEEEN